MLIFGRRDVLFFASGRRSERSKLRQQAREVHRCAMICQRRAGLLPLLPSFAFITLSFSVQLNALVEQHFTLCLHHHLGGFALP